MASACGRGFTPRRPTGALIDAAYAGARGDAAAALALTGAWLREHQQLEPIAVGHQVLHGGPRYDRPVRWTQPSSPISNASARGCSAGEAARARRSGISALAASCGNAVSGAPEKNKFSMTTVPAPTTPITVPPSTFAVMAESPISGARAELHQSFRGLAAEFET